MGDLTNARLICIPLLLLAIPFYIHRLLRAHGAENRRFVVKLLITSILILFPSYNVYQESIHNSMPWWQNSLGNVVLQAFVLLFYFAIDQFLNGNAPPVKVIVKQKAFLITATFSIMMVLVDYLRREHFVSVTDPDGFERSWIYVSAQILYNVPLIYVITLLINLYFAVFLKYKELSFIVRCIFSMLGLTVAVTIMLVAIVNTVISFAVDNPYRILVYSFVQDIGRPTVFFLILLGTVTPQPIFAKMIRPLEHYLARRQRRQHQLLSYLHERMIQIVPSVHLPNEQLRDLRLLTEIDDAREMIWSQVHRSQPMTAREEAEHLFDLLRNNDTVSQPGEQLPPVIPGNVIKHNVAVAAHLLQLENRGYSWLSKTVKA